MMGQNNNVGNVQLGFIEKLLYAEELESRGYSCYVEADYPYVSRGWSKVGIVRVCHSERRSNAESAVLKRLHAIGCNLVRLVAVWLPMSFLASLWLRCNLLILSL